jgi:hypothetical protein
VTELRCEAHKELSCVAKILAQHVHSVLAHGQPPLRFASRVLDLCRPPHLPRSEASRRRDKRGAGNFSRRIIKGEEASMRVIILSVAISRAFLSWGALAQTAETIGAPPSVPAGQA